MLVTSGNKFVATTTLLDELTAVNFKSPELVVIVFPSNTTSSTTTDPAPLALLPRIGDKSRRRVRYVELPFPYLVANHEMPLVPVQYAG